MICAYLCVAVNDYAYLGNRTLAVTVEVLYSSGSFCVTVKFH